MESSNFANIAADKQNRVQSAQHFRQELRSHGGYFGYLLLPGVPFFAFRASEQAWLPCLGYEASTDRLWVPAKRYTLNGLMGYNRNWRVQAFFLVTSLWPGSRTYEWFAILHYQFSATTLSWRLFSRAVRLCTLPAQPEGVWIWSFQTDGQEKANQCCGVHARQIWPSVTFFCVATWYQRYVLSSQHLLQKSRPIYPRWCPIMTIVRFEMSSKTSKFV